MAQVMFFILSPSCWQHMLYIKDVTRGQLLDTIMSQNNNQWRTLLLVKTYAACIKKLYLGNKLFIIILIINITWL